MKRITKTWVVATAAVTALGLAGCVAPQPKVTPTKMAIPTQTASLKPSLNEFYSQKLDWKPCEDDGKFDCVFLKVPLDYDHPTGEKAEIAMKRLATKNPNKLGSIVMNPGGPGGSGIDTMKPDAVAYFFTQRVRDNYDVLSFDPRGVNHSKPQIKCRTPKQLDEDNARYIDTSTPEGRAESVADSKLLGQRCLQNSPGITKFASTANAARDLDIMRAALGDERLNYLGYSYGTYLGTIYADLFPERVGRFILDGVLDVSADINQVATAQAAGFENSLREFSRQCQEYHRKDCPLRGGTEAGLSQIKTLLESLKTSPLPTKGGRDLTLPLAFTGIIGNMYNQASWWQSLMPALRAAILDGDGSGLLNAADMYNSRESDGSYKDNGADAFMVINSLDYVAVGTEAQWEEDAKKLEADNPTIGKLFSYPSLGLQQWPVAGDKTAKRRVNPKLDGDILLIGTTGDPATPLSMAQNVRGMMSHSKLLTVQGWNHTAYNSVAPTCVRNIGDTYLLTGQVPTDQDGTFCKVS
ncbi:TAP-like protein [Mobiluncus mulieris 28-1]|uniref:alpha/beta hydrolase n=1 Tax=Mobiluncus mulieris TaxID=2052 RepID=UPI0001BE79C6|nr:alpha/beta hydrolase [Mobiluncus mulieris]EEZ92160.1 TAP-like protein [Mobiluncus mulieris 28-1]